MTISQKSLPEIMQDLEQPGRKYGYVYVLRALYSPQQVQEQMTWFWLNHFSVHQGKSNLRAMVGDYEYLALRPHALGKFRDPTTKMQPTV